MTGYVVFAASCFGLAGILWATSAVVTRRERRREAELREGHAETTGTISLHEITQRLMSETTLEIALPHVRRLQLEPARPATRMVTPQEWEEAWGASNEMGWTLWRNDEKWRWRQLLAQFEHDMTWHELVRYGEELEYR